MKKQVLSLFFILFISGSIFSQKYVPFPTANAEWNVFYASAFNQIRIDTTLLKYSLQGDTTINGVSYHKLCKKIGTDVNPQYVFAGGLREQDKKIFYYGFGYSTSNLISYSNQEYLLYDFNKKTGDSVMFDQERWYKIINIDSVKIGSDFRKRYEIVIMHSNISEFIIEGIGDVTQGLLGMITPIPTCECYQNWEFICFSQNGESVYKNPAYVDCNSTQKWSEKKYLADDACWTYLIGIYKYQTYLNGDTILNEKTYKKVFNRLSDPEAFNLYSDQREGYVGAIREDAGKIYAELNNTPHDNFPHDFLLYDFTVNAGDTIHSSLNNGSELSHQLIVSHIDTITLLTGEKRKRMSFDYSNEWFEGIGNINGLFYPAYPLTTSMDTPHLICFKQNETELYKDTRWCPSGDCCDMLDAVAKICANKPHAELSPNPVTGSSIIKWEADNNFFSTLVVTDVLGKKIRVLNVSGKSEISIHRNDFTPGLYFGRLHAPNGEEYVIKMIIQ